MIVPIIFPIKKEDDIEIDILDVPEWAMWTLLAISVVFSGLLIWKTLTSFYL